MIPRTELSILLQLSNNHAKGITASQNLIVSRVGEVNRVLGIIVFLCWLTYLAAMHMKSQFPQAWLAHGSREISQITGGSDGVMVPKMSDVFFNGKLTSSYKLIDLSNIMMEYMKCLKHELFSREEVQHTNTN